MGNIGNSKVQVDKSDDVIIMKFGQNVQNKILFTYL